MKKLYMLFAAVLITASASAIAVAKPMDVTALDNKAILTMVERGISADAIVKAIKSSPCTFDTFPSVMKELKSRGVPEAVLEAMIDAPYGPPAESQTTLGESADAPIYHYMESIKQYLTPINTGRRYNPSSRTRAAARTRIRR